MKAKTKEQKRVESLLDKLRPLPEKAMERIERGKIAEKNQRYSYLCLWDRQKEYQVLRIYEVIRNESKRITVSVTEVHRTYVNMENGKTTTAALLKTAFTRYINHPVYSKWDGGSMEIRKDENDWLLQPTDTVKRGVHPLFGKSRIKREMTERWGVTCFIKNAFDKKNRPRVETAIQWKDDELTEIMTEVRVNTFKKEKFWRSLLIARRHGGKVDKNNYAEFMDYLKDMEILGMDTANPKYLCPKDLKEEHRKLGEKLEKKRRKEWEEKFGQIQREIEREREERKEEDDKTYRKEKEKYLKIMIKEDGMTIRPLQNIEEFQEEGKEMQHCVYRNGYYNKKNSLILTARDENDKRIETVEYDLKLKKVLQSRGVGNNLTERHRKIIEIVEKGMKENL